MDTRDVQMTSKNVFCIILFWHLGSRVILDNKISYEHKKEHLPS